jgi:hypothetical protein
VEPPISNSKMIQTKHDTTNREDDRLANMLISRDASYIYFGLLGRSKNLINKLGCHCA